MRNLSSKTLQIFELESHELDDALQEQLAKKPTDVHWLRDNKCVLCEDKAHSIHKTQMMFSSMNLSFVTDVALPLCDSCKRYFFKR